LRYFHDSDRLRTRLRTRPEEALRDCREQALEFDPAREIVLDAPAFGVDRLELRDARPQRLDLALGRCACAVDHPGTRNSKPET